MSAVFEIINLKKYFTTSKKTLYAVDGVSIFIDKGKTLSVGGEFAYGKSTLGRTVKYLLKETIQKIEAKSASFVKYTLMKKGGS